MHVLNIPFEPSTPKEKAICLSNMFVAH